MKNLPTENVENLTKSPNKLNKLCCFLVGIRLLWSVFI